MENIAKWQLFLSVFYVEVRVESARLFGDSPPMGKLGVCEVVAARYFVEQTIEPFACIGGELQRLCGAVFVAVEALGCGKAVALESLYSVKNLFACLFGAFLFGLSFGENCLCTHAVFALDVSELVVE